MCKNTTFGLSSFISGKEWPFVFHFYSFLPGITASRDILCHKFRTDVLNRIQLGPVQGTRGISL